MLISLICLATLCLGTQIHAFETKTRDEISDPLFSSMLDPEECYPTAKALGDVGIFEDRPYRGAGIKIGIIDEGIPKSLASYGAGAEAYGKTHHPHSEEVANVLSTVAGEASFYFAGKKDSSFAECFDWLVKEKHVDVINHSCGFKNGEKEGFGRYTYASSGYVDKRILDSGVPFVNSYGNEDTSPRICNPAQAINAISVGAVDSSLSWAGLNSAGPIGEYRELLDNPTVSAPGEALFDFARQRDDISDLGDTKTDMWLSGTSISAPIVTGIVALLIQEFPSLRGHAEAIQSILRVSSRAGVANYQRARMAARNWVNFTIPAGALNGEVLKSVSVSASMNERISMASFVAFNGVYAPNGYFVDPELPVPPEDIRFSRMRLRLRDPSGEVVAESAGTTSFASLEYVNGGAYKKYRLEAVLEGGKGGDSPELGSLAYFAEPASGLFSLRTTNFNLDTLPRLSWSAPLLDETDTLAFRFLNFRGQAVVEWTGLPINGSRVLTKPEWDALLSLRGRQFYAYLKTEFTTRPEDYSDLYTYSEPQSFGVLSNINPADFQYPDAYNAEPLRTELTVGGHVVNVERLRCGYIQKQYINLSAKREGAGSAYLQLTFGERASYVGFGVTRWRSSELLSGQGDKATVETLGPDGKWRESLDLLRDIRLPDSRKDILRFDARDVFGIRFSTTSNPVGDRNKGRLCIDNISFSFDPTFENPLCRFTEPIVEDTTFGLR